jgi:hypothetical protein
VLLDGIFEYQTAFVHQKGDTEAYAIMQGIEQFNKAGRAKMPKAPAVPVLPQRVTIKQLVDEGIAGPDIPYGLHERTITPAYISFTESLMARCLFNRTRDGVGFIEAFIELLYNHQKHYKPNVLDLAGLLPETTLRADSVVCDDQAALAFFEALQNRRKKAPMKPRLVMMSGIAQFMLRIDPNKAKAIKSYLKTLSDKDKVVFFLFDSAGDALTYTSEDWFKSQLGSRNGLWVGEGMSNQSAYTVNFGGVTGVDPTIKGDRGYEIVDGTYHPVKFLSSDDEEPNEAMDTALKSADKRKR